MIAARADGLTEAIGLSNITPAHLRQALPVTRVACVQTEFHLANRLSQPVLDECTRRGIAFVPFASLGFGVPGPDSVLGQPAVVREAARLGVTPAQGSRWPGRWPSHQRVGHPWNVLSTPPEGEPGRVGRPARRGGRPPVVRHVNDIGLEYSPSCGAGRMTTQQDRDGQRNRARRCQAGARPWLPASAQSQHRLARSNSRRRGPSAGETLEVPVD